MTSMTTLMRAFLLATAGALTCSASAAERTGQEAGPITVDPMLIAQAAEVWPIIAAKPNAIWPGWDASSTPILLYFPDKQDVLINHPDPPKGFVRYNGPLTFPNGTIYLRNGKTIEEFDGQNTSTAVNGTSTLVVADTLSSRRQTIQSIANSAAGGAKNIDDQINGGLFPNPYDNLQTIVHEAFHVYQGHRAPDKGGNEMVLAEYPSLSVVNNVDTALEADYLRAALTAKSKDDVRQNAVRWLAVRQERRRELSPELVAYENGTEFLEGLAKYTEYRLLQVLEGRAPSNVIWWCQGFTGYEDLSQYRLQLLSRMAGMMSGEVGVNNDLYGASPVRMRLYFSGMGQAALLDSLGANWQDRIFEADASLSSLLEEAIGASPKDLEHALKEVKAGPRVQELQAQKQKLADDGAKYVEKVVQSIESSPRVVIDFSDLANAKPRMGFTPFGVLRVDSDRSVFRLVPISGKIGDLVFRESTGRDLLLDRTKKQIILTLTGDIDASKLAEEFGNPELMKGGGVMQEVKLPGVTLSKGHVRVSLDGKAVVVKLLEAAQTKVAS